MSWQNKVRETLYESDKFLTFIIYGKVTQNLYHQFTWVNCQTDSSVISHWSWLRITHLLRQCLGGGGNRFWEFVRPTEDKFNLTLFLMRARIFFSLLWVILLLMSVYLGDTISWTQNLILFICYRFKENKKILYKKSTKWS